MKTTELSIRLRAWRAQHGLSQSQAAAHIGIELERYRDWECGRRGTKLAAFTLNKINEALDAPLAAVRQ